MVCCFVTDCCHSSDSKAYDCKFRRFPTQPQLKKKWIELIRRSDKEPSSYSRVCSCHFLNGDFSTLPSIFQRNRVKRFAFASPPGKRKRRSGVCQQTSGTDSFPDISSINIDAPSCSSKVSVHSQTDHIFRSEFYESQLYFKNQEIDHLKEENCRLTTQPFGYFVVSRNDHLCLHYTGLSLSAFNIIKELCSLIKLEYYNNKPVQRLSFEDQLLLTLMKLRLNSSYTDLGMRFGIVKSTVFNIVNTFLPVLHIVVFQSVMDKIPPQEKNKASLPPAFASYSNCRIIIDCTEMRCEVPKKMDQQKLTYSYYKKHNTIKPVLAISPNAAVTYCSDVYPGSTSDKEIVKHCGILNQLEPGDLVLADKGFLISDLLPQGVSLNIPPFLSTTQFTEREVTETRNIAKARVHIERVNQRLKRYRILNLIPKSLFTKASMVVQTCVGLINFQNPLLKCMSKDFIINPSSMDCEEIEMIDVWE